MGLEWKSKCKMLSVVLLIDWVGVCIKFFDKFWRSLWNDVNRIKLC